MNRQILLGDEAVARGAIDAGISGAYAYPGTPSTEIFEYIHSQSIQEELEIHARWSTNEKVAYEEALGMSYAGRRAIVSFKHVGLNVAADPFISSTISGVHGGLLVVVADDPFMHSSQNEQDSRFYARFAQIVCLEPADQQQAYSMAREGLDLSESLNLPVMLRLVTRLAHSRSIVALAEPRQQNVRSLCPDTSYWTLLPSNARRGFERLLDKQAELRALSENHPANQLTMSGNGKTGIIAAGIAQGYVQEALGDRLADCNLLCVGFYPLPVDKVKKLIESSSEVWVLEDGYPFIEQQLTGEGMHRGLKVRGKVSGDLPRSGELTPDLVRAVFGAAKTPAVSLPGIDKVVRPRPPVLCEGCPHSDTYQIIREATRDYRDVRIMGDIGCYTLGFYKPHEGLHSCICMGASIGMAAGISHAGFSPVLCVIGDSTFAHSGLTPLLDAARENTNIKVFILDNSIVAMTGGQPTMATDEAVERIVAGLGVPSEHIKVIKPLPRNLDDNVRVVRDEIEYRGLSVIIARRECVTYYKEIKTAKSNREGESR
ncbi:MAG: indolepyruvate ferredoxin oxidoreductase [Acidobacteria bacterium]|nr:MAG: indolepyruvate ferredoxin oxidoreductase [Acidobacteriota bacterium]